jgi:hypothetical protein
MARNGGFLASILGMCGGCLGFGREEASERVQADGPIDRVDIDLDAGEVMLVGHEGEGVLGTVTSRWTDQPPEVVHYVQDGVLHVLGRCDAYAVPCLVDVSLTVPPGADVRVDTDVGSVTVRAIDGDVEVSTLDGDVEARAIGGGLFVESGGGDIRGEELTGALVDARTMDGDVSLSLTTAPSRVVGRTASGDVHIRVPDGTYRVEADAQGGEVEIASAILQDTSADAVIVAESASGDVHVEGPDNRGGK